MRFDVKKYLFIGHKGALEQFFETAQENGLVHFIDTSRLKIELPSDIQNLTTAIKTVLELPTLDQKEPESPSMTDEIVNDILSLKHAIDKLEEEKRTTKLEMARIDVFGQFSLDDIAFIEREGKRKVQFFFAKKGIKDEMKLPEELIFVDTEYDLDYFISINKVAKQYDKMIEMQITSEYDALKKRLEEVEEQISKKEQKLKSFAKYDAYLHQALIKKTNDFNLVTSKKYALEKVDGKLFAITGWVPEKNYEKLEKVMKDVEVDIYEIAIEENEVAPTYLENAGASRIGEDLVHVYDTPSNTDKDPSLWILLSFALFFAMIINDGGYGLIFLAAALFFRWKRPKLKKTGKRIWKLVLILCSFCIAWGILTNSFFGMSVGPESGVRKVSLLNWLVEKKAAYHFEKKDPVYSNFVKKFPEAGEAEHAHQFLLSAKKEIKGEESYEMVNQFSDSILMELALLVGIIHVSIGFLRYLGRNFAGIGWVIAIIGAYLYLPVFLGATTLVHYVAGFNREVVAKEGLYLIIGGVSLALVLSLIQNKIFGLLEITNVIQIFADILSYLRLYALGLAGAIISATVNDIAGSLIFLGGGVLLLLGHALNMVLSVIGGIIHGLRLNYIEWYHYCFEGGGKVFDPLRKLEVE